MPEKSDRVLYRIPLATTFLLAGFFFCFSLFWLYLGNQFPLIYRENGPMENFQAACLFLSLLFLWFCIWTANRPAQRILFCGLMLLYLNMLVRELDFRSFDLPRLNFWLRGSVRNVWLSFCWAAGLILFLRNARPVWNEFLGWLRQPASAWLLLAGSGWIIGGAIDQLKPFTGSPRNLMAEELVETNAAMAMLASAALTTFFRNRPSTSAVPISR